MTEKIITIKGLNNWHSLPTKQGLYLLRRNDVTEVFVFVFDFYGTLRFIDSNKCVKFINDSDLKDCKWFGPIKNS